MKPQRLNFEAVFEISVQAQKFNGSHPFIKRNWKWIIYFFTCMVVYWILGIQLIYNVYINVRDRNVEEGCKHGIFCCVAFIITFKYLIMLFYQKQLQHLIQTMNNNYEEALRFADNERLIVEKYAYKGRWVSKLWMCTGFITSSLFPVKAIILMIYSALFNEPKLYWVIEMPFVPLLDQFRDNLYFYIIMFIGSTAFAIYSATMYMSFDPLGPIFMLHACGQLEIAERQIKKMFEPKSVDEVIDSQIEIVKRLQQVHRFVWSIQRYMAVVYEMIIKVTTVLIPFTAYEIIETLKHNEVSVEFISFFFGCIVHVYVPCYYSELLLDKSKMVADAIYSCGWESAWDRRTSSNFKIMILTASKPIAIRTVFTVMGLNTFSHMCRTSYSIFNLMNAKAI